MKNSVFLFPGQGSQALGMAKDLYDHFPSVRQRFDQANDVLDFDLRSLCFEGPEDQLKQTRYTQPAIFVHSVAAAEILTTAGLKPLMTAGHSLGEFAAIVSAGVVSFEDGLHLVRRRGDIMQRIGKENAGSMAAIMGLEFINVHKICQQASEYGLVKVANFNSPEQIVISGTESGVEKAVQMAQEAGAKRVAPLNVSGAFHSPLMNPAMVEFGTVLETMGFNDPALPVYQNVTGKPTTAATDIRALLLKQLISPVMWNNTIQNMIHDGADQFYEVGPGKVLTGLLRKIDRSVKCSPAGTVEQIQEILERVA